MAKKRNAYRVWGRKAEGRKSFGRPNRRCEAIIKKSKLRWGKNTGFIWLWPRTNGELFLIRL
jgi:hypothetical protein